MKKLHLFFSIMFLSCVATLCLTSCGDDDDDNTPTVPEDKATTVETQAGVYVPENVINFFDVVLTAPDGTQVTLTTENTTEDNNLSFGNVTKTDKALFNSDISKTQTNVRLYKFAKSTIKSFPATYEYKMSAKAKSNVTPTENDKFSNAVVWVSESKNNSKNNSWDSYSLSNSSVSVVLSGKKWDDIKTKDNLFNHTLKLTFANAKSMSGSAN